MLISERGRFLRDPESTFKLLQNCSPWDVCGCYGANGVIAFVIERNDILSLLPVTFTSVLQVNTISSLIKTNF